MELERPVSLGRVYQMLAETLRRAIGGVLTIAQWMSHEGRLTRAFRDTPRRKRWSQGARARSLALNGGRLCF